MNETLAAAGCRGWLFTVIYDETSPIRRPNKRFPGLFSGGPYVLIIRRRRWFRWREQGRLAFPTRDAAVACMKNNLRFARTLTGPS